MEYTALIILMALAQYVYFSVRVAAARGKYGVNAPKTSGREEFEREYRVQMNTLEQLIVFIPSLWLFSTMLSASWALIPGIMFIVGRQLYALEYVKDPSTRVRGMALTLLANGVLMIGALAGVIIGLV